MTSYVVLDASFVYKSLAPGSQRDKCRQLIHQWKQEKQTLCSPTIWVYEFTSLLTKLVYWGELSEQDAQESLAFGLDLGVELIVPTEDQVRQAFLWTRQLNRVAAYDSFYVALAESLGCELWTADTKLANAVDRPWVKVVV
ncbi:MAG: type II toxin-antitoxin system VapC family toxin [Anaerolineae bacterium]|nr:type II toxin-antitoxin system VapC family toxin [Anaerolineae bacterium]